jgi:hypothetical protein
MIADVDLRAPVPQPDPDGGDEGVAPAPDPTGPVSWRVDRRLTVAKSAGAVIFTVAALIGYPDWGEVLVVGCAAALAAAMAARDLMAPVPLAADADGLTIRTGFAGVRRLEWAQIQRVVVDARRGLVLRSQVLELDTGDNLYFFGINDLGVAPQDVADTLQAFRSRSEQ